MYERNFKSGIERAENFSGGHGAGRNFIGRARAGDKIFSGLRACRAFFIRKCWARAGRAQKLGTPAHLYII